MDRAAAAAGQVLPDVVIEDLECRDEEPCRPIRVSAGASARYEPEVALGVVPATGVTCDEPLEVVDQRGETEHTGTALTGRLPREPLDDSVDLAQRTRVRTESKDDPGTDGLLRAARLTGQPLPVVPADQDRPR